MDLNPAHLRMRCQAIFGDGLERREGSDRFVIPEEEDCFRISFQFCQNVEQIKTFRVNRN